MTQYYAIVAIEGELEDDAPYDLDELQNFLNGEMPEGLYVTIQGEVP